VPARLFARAFVIVLIALASLAGSVVTADAQLRSCTVARQNLFVREAMQEHYFWYRFLPDPDPTRFPSPEAYLDRIRYRPLDESFSYISGKAADQAYYGDSQYVGFGFSTTTALTADGASVQMRVTQVYPESPAAEIGLARGDTIVAVQGRTVGDWWRAGQLGSMFGPSDPGVQRSVVFHRGPEDTAITATMIKRLVTIPTVSLVEVYEVDGRRVGYVFFRNFVQPSVEALNAAFEQLREAEVRELVLDLRYNGGGLVSVAQHLASLIGGVRTSGQVFAEYFHNDRNAFRNRIVRFEEKPNWLTLDRLVVITTRSSASASELVVNSLRPFMPVVLIGDTTYGKPVGQYSIDFCDRVLHPVAFTLRNADAFGDYFGGFPANCPDGDDLEHQLGDPAEASLAEALHFVRTGTCSRPPAEATARARAVRTQRDVLRPTGFQQLVGAW
jgi:carboxyl-terminal processing protease